MEVLVRNVFERGRLRSPQIRTRAENSRAIGEGSLGVDIFFGRHSGRLRIAREAVAALIPHVFFHFLELGTETSIRIRGGGRDFAPRFRPPGISRPRCCHGQS